MSAVLALTLALGSAPVAASAPVATCLLAADDAGVRRLLGAAPGTAERDAALAAARPALRKCNADGNATDDALAAVATHLLRKDYGGYPFEKLPRAAATVAQTEAMRRATADWPVADSVGRCVVARDVQLAVRLVRATPGSRGERTALDGVRPLLAGCVDAGASVNLTEAGLRGGIARALYRDILSSIREIWPA